MAKFDMYNNVKVLNALNIQTISSDTTTNGNIIDLKGFEACTFVFHMGTLTDGDYTILIQEGDESNLSDAAAVADADLIGTEAGGSFVDDADDNQISKIGYIGDKRYVRFNVVSTNTATSGATMGAQVVLGHPHLAPQTTQTN